MQTPMLSPIQAVQYKTGIVGSDGTSPLVYAQAGEAVSTKQMMRMRHY